MAWVRLDDQMHANRKVQKLLHLGETRSAAALGLWAIGASWCGASRTDGFLPRYMLDLYDANAATYAAMLVEVGLWEPVHVRGEDGFRYHDWMVYNDPKDKQDRDAATRRRDNHLKSKSGALCDAIKRRDGGYCRYCGTKVDWNDRRSPKGATYDHVDPLLGLDVPAEGNTYENVVTSCRSCNAAKGKQTPEEWGVPLLDPRGKFTPSSAGSRSGSRSDSSRTQKPRGTGRVGTGSGGSGPDPDLGPGTRSGSGGAR